MAFAALLTAHARADADLPADIAIDASSVPTAVIAATEPYCGDRRAGGFPLPRRQWTFHKAALGDGATVYFIQCRAAGSNDLHAVVVESAAIAAELQTFGRRNYTVANARWIAGERTIVDVSGSSAGCAFERQWRWNGRQFEQRSPVTRHGCADRP